MFTFLTLLNITASLFTFLPILQQLPIRLPLALLATLFIPGYLFISCLFPKRRTIDPLVRIGLSIAATIAIVIAVTLLLSYTPIARSGPGEIFTMDGVTALLAAIAVIRTARLPSSLRVVYQLPLQFPDLHDPFLRLSLIGLLLIAVLGIIPIAVQSDREETTLALATAGIVAESVTPSSVSVTVTSHESIPTQFSITVEHNHEIVSTTAPFVLAPTQSRTFTITFNSLEVTSPTSLVVILYKNGQPAPYRQLRVWERTIHFHPQP